MGTSTPRASGPVAITIPGLGGLRELPGTWVGTGFSLVSVPLGDDDFRVIQHPTFEILTFSQIGAPVPNKGSVDQEITFLGVEYDQKVIDPHTKEGLHRETGFWLNMPDGIFRLSTIPHGDALIAQGSKLEDLKGEPPIEVVDPTPFTVNASGARVNVTDPKYTPKLMGVPPLNTNVIADPNKILKDELAKIKQLGRKIVSTTTLFVNANPVAGINGMPISETNSQFGNISNVPFIKRNAPPTSFSAIFWIETVEIGLGIQVVQLQYTQTAILDFNDLKWPHITVATLLKL
jgi:hypothetical protein